MLETPTRRSLSAYCRRSLSLCIAALLLTLSVSCMRADDKPADSAANPGASQTGTDPGADGAASKSTSNGKSTAPADRIANPFPNRKQAASLNGGLGWLNTSKPITLEKLRGKVVLIDFWTYCCINCMHVLPDLKYLEQKYANELVVIGVHSAKFTNERGTEQIRQAIMRYEIEHPVVNDGNMTIWRRYGSNSWPTLVLIDPEGNYCGYVSGEGNRQLLEKVIDRLIAYHAQEGTLNRKPIKFDLEVEKRVATPLWFPGKVLCDQAGDRLFISDSNHNRIVIASLDGKVQAVVGSGKIGADNGAYDRATFNHPQGMALSDDGKTLYVADTENHLLRKIDLKNQYVFTFAGTGKQASYRARGGKLLETELNSPWDLDIVDGVLYVAMAGPHQIWSHELGSETIRVYAGTGREDIIDGPLERCALAQPSGLAHLGHLLFVCDSEGSAIRQIDLKAKKVTTLVGCFKAPQSERLGSNQPQPNCLFEFGDRDGVGSEARLQHPLGIAAADGMLYVADTYNQKIKRVQVATGHSTGWLGTGEAGEKLDPPQFYEPGGLALDGSRLYISDTNNHRICIADLKTGKVQELVLTGLTPPQQAEISGN